MQDLTIMTHQAPGIASFDNFEEIKAALETHLSAYQNIVYTEESLKTAKADKAALNKLKKALDDRRKEIKKIYMEPYLELEAQIKELIALIDAPLGEINGFVRQMELNEKAQKRLTIREYYDKISGSLGQLAEQLFDSPAFFDSKWELKSTSVKAWQDAVKDKVTQAAHDLQALQATGDAALIAHYLETMDMEDTLRYQKSLQAAQAAMQTQVVAEDGDDNVVGYKVLKLSGNARRMAQVMEQLELLGVEYEVLEDGMPKELEELTAPDFDSFVCFDIETSGTFGAANGDGPAEITEIGAVRVIDGKIFDRQDWLCNPGRKITPRIARLTHITDEMVADAPSVGEVIGEFAQYIKGLPIVGHNIKSSDLHYISAAAKRAGVVLSSPFFDTYLYAKKLKSKYGWENVKLEYLSKQFGVEQPDAHRAWCDAEANVGVYQKLKEL